MAYKDLGPNVSQKPQAVVPGGGQFSAEDRSFESVIFQANKPFADWEMNLMQEVAGISRQGVFGRLPSCWLTGDFLERADSGGSYLFYAPDPPLATTANRFKMTGADLVVNGWPIHFEFTESATAGINQITLPAPPVGVGTNRTDLVILEVWRALISPLPSTENKSPAGQILRHGNAKSPDALPPGNENLADDLVDPQFAAMVPPVLDTTRRVQIQYRYRVVPGVDLKAYPDGLDSPAVLANTVPYLGGSGVDGNATVFPYSKSPSDSGLWIAGTNDAAGVLAVGSVDGLMYAIPVCAVPRRNSAPFDRTANINGGSAMATGVPTRPDGLYCDQIVLGDVKDLRKAVAWDLHEVMVKASHHINDNSMTAENDLTSDGPAGTSFLARDNIGAASHPGTSDSVRRHFSDRSITEAVVCRVDIGGVAVPSVNIDLNAILLSWGAAPLNVQGLAPVGTEIADVVQVRVVDAVGTSDEDGLNTALPYVDHIEMQTAIGPGVDRVLIAFDAPLANKSLFVELLIRYPADCGMKRNVLSLHQVWASTLPAWADAAGFTATSDANRLAVPQALRWTKPGHREVAVHLQTVDQTSVFYASNPDELLVWERLSGDPITIDDGVNPVYQTTNYTFNTAYTSVFLSGAVPIPAGNSVQVTYKAFRAVPPQGVAPNDSYQVFYQTRAVQTVPVPAGAQTLELIPRAVSRHMVLLTNGSGSPDDGFPYEAASAQVPVGQLPSFPESNLDAPNIINSAGFIIDTGYVELPAIVPYVPNPGQVTLYKAAPDVTMDSDGRSFWPKSDPGIAPSYSPVAFAQPMSSKQRHKVALPTLMELKSDFAGIGRKGTMVLVLVTSWSDFDDQNAVTMTSVLGNSCAAVYRVRGNVMNPRRTDV